MTRLRGAPPLVEVVSSFAAGTQKAHPETDALLFGRYGAELMLAPGVSRGKVGNCAEPRSGDTDSEGGRHSPIVQAMLELVRGPPA